MQLRVLARGKSDLLIISCLLTDPNASLRKLPLFPSQMKSNILEAEAVSEETTYEPSSKPGDKYDSREQTLALGDNSLVFLTFFCGI